MTPKERSELRQRAAVNRERRKRPAAQRYMPLSKIAEIAKHHPFWRNVAVGQAHECWRWTGKADSGGYGIFGRTRAHRVAFELHQRRDLLAGEVVRHTCDRPWCCNPRHLNAGTQLENVADRQSRERMARGEHNGRAILDRTAVMRIYLSSGSASSVAKAEGVSKWTVIDIRSGKTWGWLTGSEYSHATPSDSHGATGA